MASQLTVFALLAPAAAVWVIQPPMQYYLADHYNPFSVFRRGHDPFSVFDRAAFLPQRRLNPIPFSAMLEPRRGSFSTTLDALLDGLQREYSHGLHRKEAEPSWKEHVEHVEARLLVRGLKADQLKAEVSDGILTVRGEREECKSTVSRSLSLPFEVTDAAQISLSLDADGVLSVKVPKATRAPEKTATPLRVVAAEPVGEMEDKDKDKDKEADALPSPTPEAVEAETLRALESKFPQGPAPPDVAPTPADATQAPDEAAAGEPAGATERLRSAIKKTATMTTTTAAMKHEDQSTSVDVLAPAAA